MHYVIGIPKTLPQMIGKDVGEINNPGEPRMRARAFWSVMKSNRRHDIIGKIPVLQQPAANGRMIHFETGLFELPQNLVHFPGFMQYLRVLGGRRLPKHDLPKIVKQPCSKCDFRVFPFISRNDLSGGRGGQRMIPQIECFQFAHLRRLHQNGGSDNLRDDPVHLPQSQPENRRLNRFRALPPRKRGAIADPQDICRQPRINPDDISE